MNIVDILIILVLIFGAIVGFKKGFTKQLVSFLGTILIVILAFAFKNTVSIWMYEYLPFFGFGGIFKGVTVLNIILYEVIAFFVVFAILQIILKVVLFLTGILEKIFDLTIILGIFSKLLGAVVGVLEYFVIVFIVLYIVSLPLFNLDLINESKYKDKILKNTPLLSGYVEESLKVVDRFAELKDKYEVVKDPNAFNLEALDLFLEYKVITLENTDMLVKKGKLKIDNIECVLEKYRKGETNENRKCY